jgi:hypothetical protein
MDITLVDYEVIPALYHVNKKTGQRVSMWGAAPHGSDWEVKQFGYTIRWPDGTIGLTYSASFDKTLDRNNRDAIEAVAKAAAARGFRGWNPD